MIKITHGKVRNKQCQNAAKIKIAACIVRIKMVFFKRETSLLEYHRKVKNIIEKDINSLYFLLCRSLLYFHECQSQFLENQAFLIQFFSGKKFCGIAYMSGRCWQMIYCKSHHLKEHLSERFSITNTYFFYYLPFF